MLKTSKKKKKKNYTENQKINKKGIESLIY
jgi:hypothetical protein